MAVTTPRQGWKPEGDSTMRSPWFRIIGPAVLCLALLPAGALGDAPKAPKKEASLDAQALAARIDAYIARRWDEAKVVPAARTNDAEVLRRIYLDLVGRIPSVSEIHEFLRDTSPDKRRKKIESLLDSHGYVANFTNVWRDMMIPQTNNQFFQAFGPQMEAWLRKKLQDNTSYDEMVRALLTADPIGNRVVTRTGRPPDQADFSVVAFYQANELKPENLAAATSRLFLGIKLECAQCHDHPFNQYSREQFWEYAAFFAGIQPFRQQGQRFVPAQNKPGVYEIKIGNTERVAKAKFLDGKQPKFTDGVDGRVTLAEWMTSPNNPYFARAAVNHIWAHFFGLGIIDPIDEPSDENPPSHPELLDEIAHQFALNKFDLKYLVKAITLSKTYQLTSRQTHPTQNDPRMFARMSLKGQTPEQLYDSLVLATRYRDPADPQNRLARQRFFGVQGEFRTKFANHADRRTEYQTSILQALTLMNGRFIADATSVTRSETLAGVIDAPFMDTEGKLNALYLAALSRNMRPDEKSRLVRYVDSGGPSRDSDKALADVFWAILNSSEFILNH